MEEVAIIGTGIAGMACAWYLRDRFRLTLFEKDKRPGGHTHTVTVGEGGREVPVDTGFMVYNEKTYPNLVRLFEELQVETMATDMSFGVRHEADNLAYAVRGLNTFFAQRTNALRPRYWRFIGKFKRFFREANDLHQSGESDALSLGEFLERNGFEGDFANWFIVPMAAAIWSTPPEGIRNYPCATLFRFLSNHGVLGIGQQLQWRTVKGGSRVYRDRILGALEGRVQLGNGVQSIRRLPDGAQVTDSQGQAHRFDHVIVATHADQALRLLEQPTALEAELLGAFRYTRNPVVLHSDPSVMPRQRAAWASWNFHYYPEGMHLHAGTHYWMNRLQGISKKQPYFVSVNYDRPLHTDRIHWTGLYDHPYFDAAAIRAQKRLGELNRGGSVYYCGSYFRHGFHEDALVSALGVVEALTAQQERMAS